MTFTEAAAEVLRLAGKALHYKEITELAIEKNLLSHVGKSPEVTMGARLAALLKKEDKTNPIVRVKPGVFALRDWDEKKSKRAPKGSAAVPQDEPADDTGAADINALEVEAAAAQSAPPPAKGSAPLLPGFSMADDDEDDKPIVSGEDALRADLAAQGAELFDDEDDDDQPILAPPGSSGAVADAAQGEGGRRRRRRRRRGRGGVAGEVGDRASSPRLDGQAAPAAATGAGSSPASLDGEPSTNGEAREPREPRDPLSPSPRPMVRDRQQIMAGGAPSGIDVPLGEGEELAGRELADATLLVLQAFDRSAGPVPARSIVDALMRRGRLAGDPAVATVQLTACLRADNLRRQSSGQRPRFRFSNGARIAPTDWALGADLVRLEQDVIAAVERYREGARRMMLRRLQELPGHAFLELALFALERVGMSQLRPVRRAGSPGGEAHFAAIHRTGTDEIRTAIVLRKDGREIGRERVSDVRGALHHYGPAACGWLVTTGQVLSGAREEASAPNAAPIALFDGLALCRLLEEHDIAVIKSRFPIAIPDLELLETLRG